MTNPHAQGKGFLLQTGETPVFHRRVIGDIKENLLITVLVCVAVHVAVKGRVDLVRIGDQLLGKFGRNGIRHLGFDVVGITDVIGVLKQRIRSVPTTVGDVRDALLGGNLSHRIENVQLAFGDSILCPLLRIGDQA